MATSAATLIQRTRRFMGDWPQVAELGASVSNSLTTLTVADNSIYSAGWIIQTDAEALYVTGITGTTVVNVRRGIRGTTAASHASAAEVLIRPHFLDVEYLDALNSGINAAFPLLYQAVSDETTNTTSTGYEYTIPTLNGSPIPFISRLSFKITSDLVFRDFSSWDIVRGATPVIRLRRPLPPGVLRIYGFGPIPTLTDTTSSLSAVFPVRAEDALTFYAGQYLLASGEARRVREDTGARDDREMANRIGGSMNAAQSILQRYYARLQQAAMPPMPKNVKSVI